jgi:sn-glycerol 3-phosphate transport system ATP-binding protein
MGTRIALLKDGVVQQLGTPREIYESPANTYVARFIGTPPMNLIALESGRIAGSAVDTGLASAATIGIRPEDIALEAAGVAADVRSVEYLGADLVLACVIGSQTVLVRTDGQHQARAGQRIGVQWSPRDVHAFDAAGRRIH